MRESFEDRSPVKRSKRSRGGVRTSLIVLSVCGLGLCSGGPAAVPALAITPSPPPGAPAVESAPSSLVGLDPELPAGVIGRERCAKQQLEAGEGDLRDGVDQRHPDQGRRRHDDPRQRDLSHDRVRPAGSGPVPGAADDDPLRQGQGGSSSPGSASSASGGAATGGADNYLAQRGYIEVVEDVRGTGDSNGSWGLFDPIQQQDAIRVLDWAAHLPYSDGRVGTYGPSYLGIDQMLLAGAVGRHSPLKAIFPMVTGNDLYRDTSFMGGLLDFEFSEAYLGLTAGLNTTNPFEDAASDPAMLSDLAGIEGDHVNGLASYHAAATRTCWRAATRPTTSAYWQARNPQNVIRRVVANHIPAYLVGGEFDIFQRGEPLNYAELQNAWDGRSATAPMLPRQRTTGRYQLIDGPWEHLNGSSVDVDPLELEWFDTWLKHERTGHGGDSDAAALLRPRHRPVR